MRIFYIIVIVSLFAINCNTSTERELLVNDNLIAKGNISSDSVYNGKIDFIDKVSKKLKYSATFYNGTLEGEKLDYYSNGKVYSREYYKEGLLNGKASFYDPEGYLILSRYYYHGLQAGPVLEFDAGKIKTFQFFSFDRDLLLSINYDSLKNKKLPEINEEYFFFTSSDFKYLGSLEGSNNKEYFLYLPYPPKFQFKYSLVEIDSAYNEKKSYSEFNNQNIWTKFSIENYVSNRFAIKLYILDSIKNETYTLFKRL